VIIFLIFFMISVSVVAGDPLLKVVTPESGVDFVHRSGPGLMQNPEVVGPGLALPDIDGDGLPDLYLVNGADMAADGSVAKRHPDRLFHNRGDLEFVDVTTPAGLVGEGIGQGVTAVDADNDGYVDLLLTGYGEGRFYKNNGDGTFREVGRKLGIAPYEFGMSTAFADYNRDGLLDIYVANYVEFDYRLPYAPRVQEIRGRPTIPSLGPNFRGLPNYLLRADADGRYTDRTVSAKVGDNASFFSRSMGTLFADLDRDGWPDILVANDQASMSFYRNRPMRSFEESAAESYLQDIRGHMGLALGDQDANGLFDVFVTNFDHEHNALFRQLKPNRFAEVAQRMGTAFTDEDTVGWGTAFIDLDTDGWLDLVAGNGHLLPKDLKKDTQLPARIVPWAQPMHVYVSEAGTRLRAVSDTAIAPANTPTQARGLAQGDLDNDGVQDLVIAINNGAPLILRNVAGQRANGAVVELVGTTSNRAAIGTVIEALPRTAAGPPRAMRMALAGNGYLSSDADALHVTFGAGAGPTFARITWPRGTYTDVTLEPGKRVRIVEP
jgi:hypothetical protein